VRSINSSDSYDKCYQLCGPKTYTLQELVQYTADTLGIWRKIIPLNDLLSRLQAMVFNFVPSKPFSTDNYLSAKTDSACSVHDLARYGIVARSIESIVPTYLKQESYRSSYTRFRSGARR